MAVLTTDARPFSFHPTCQQCNYVGASITFCPGDGSANVYPNCAYASSGIHLHLSCSQCQFPWVSWTAQGPHS